MQYSVVISSQSISNLLAFKAFQINYLSDPVDIEAPSGTIYGSTDDVI